MNVNINLTPKKGALKKIIILGIFALLCFFLNEKVFAADLDGNDTSGMPPFLQDYYDMSIEKFTCDDETQSYCNLYHNLEQVFAEFHLLYQKVVVADYGTTTHIFFFLDKPYSNLNTINNLYNKREELSFLNSSGGNLPYYKISIVHYALEYSTIKYYYGTETDYNCSTIAPDETTLLDDFYTNFDLYSQNATLVHKSDVMNFTYIDVPGGSVIALIPKVSDNLGSYINYNKENLYGAWWDIENDKFEQYTAFDKPVTGNLTHNLDFSSYRVGNYYYYIGNKGSNTATIGYIASDFDIVVYKNFYSEGFDSKGNSYYNPFSKLDDQINKDEENIFDVIASLPSKIATFFTNLSKSIGNFFSDLLEGIKSLFIPDFSLLEDSFKDQYDYINKKLGFLTYPIRVVVDFADRFYALSDSNSAVFKIPKLEVFNYTLYEGTSFDLMTLVNGNQNIKRVYDIYKIAVSGFIVLWLVQLAVKKEQEIFGGGTGVN